MYENAWTDASRLWGGVIGRGKAAKTLEGFYDGEESVFLQRRVSEGTKQRFAFLTCPRGEDKKKDGAHFTMIWVAWGYNSVYFRE